MSTQEQPVFTPSPAFLFLSAEHRESMGFVQYGRTAHSGKGRLTVLPSVPFPDESTFLRATDWRLGLDRQSSWPGPALPEPHALARLAKQLARASGTVLAVVLNQVCNPDPPLVRRYLAQRNRRAFDMEAARHPRDGAARSRRNNDVGSPDFAFLRRSSIW